MGPKKNEWRGVLFKKENNYVHELCTTPFTIMAKHLETAQTKKLKVPNMELLDIHGIPV